MFQFRGWTDLDGYPRITYLLICSLAADIPGLLQMVHQQTLDMALFPMNIFRSTMMNTIITYKYNLRNGESYDDDSFQF